MLALPNVSLWNNISNECVIDAQFVCLFVAFFAFVFSNTQKGVSIEVFRLFRRWLLSERQLLFRPGQTKRVLLRYIGVVLPFVSSALRFAGAVCVHVPWKSLEAQRVLGSPVLLPPTPPPRIHTHFYHFYLPLHHTYEATAQGLLWSASLRSDCESVKSNIWSAGWQRSKFPLEQGWRHTAGDRFSDINTGFCFGLCRSGVDKLLDWDLRFDRGAGAAPGEWSVLGDPPHRRNKIYHGICR